MKNERIEMNKIIEDRKTSAAIFLLALLLVFEVAFGKSAQWIDGLQAENFFSDPELMLFVVFAKGLLWVVWVYLLIGAVLTLIDGYLMIAEYLKPNSTRNRLLFFLMIRWPFSVEDLIDDIRFTWEIRHLRCPASMVRQERKDQKN